jgi:hypothetical protein
MFRNRFQLSVNEIHIAGICLGFTHGQLFDFNDPAYFSVTTNNEQNPTDCNTKQMKSTYQLPYCSVQMSVESRPDPHIAMMFEGASIVRLNH